ncbi:MAG: MarR family transcriptional regulator [Acidimicrobiia bacterium]|jgi:DNA-binding MarR family transcriptional regulator|nr:MarR family transcriptional regulator [Actinomycetota bacterium]NDE60277.1 MarR family transcriptional regulator [Acidimicrobiia bacterium]NDA77162.1 MarR family transcriptional regulator [Actinomycetota bacterium]NDD97695.1 MarR family transcriptional regulator [Actinomycetota bacterium]NDE79337.1 MarR family transcriptional regulator [Actinomycetota bacterium]
MAGPKWLDPEEMKAWRLYITTSVDLMKALEEDVRQFGLTMGDYQLLAMISEAPDRRLRMCDLADQLRLSRSGLTRRMEGVLTNSWVARVQDDADRRVAYAELTTKGWNLLRKVAPIHLDSVRRLMIDHLSRSEIKAIGNAFAKISEAINP